VCYPSLSTGNFLIDSLNLTGGDRKIKHHEGGEQFTLEAKLISMAMATGCTEMTRLEEQSLLHAGQGSPTSLRSARMFE